MAGEWVPDACVLPTAEQPVRIAEFDALFGAVLRSSRYGAMRLDLTLPGRLEAAARDLARRESECCSFFAFGFEPAGDTVEMRIEVPPDHSDVLDALAARLARSRPRGRAQCAQ